MILNKYQDILDDMDDQDHVKALDMLTMFKQVRRKNSTFVI